MLAKSHYTVRTSDRRTARRCLRKWDYIASIRKNLRRKGGERNIHFWFGSGLHFAFEDYFGWNKFGDPRRAFKAYYAAHKAEELPENAYAMMSVGIAMLTYFLSWYPKHNHLGFETLWVDANGFFAAPFTEGAEPQVEKSFDIDMGIQLIVEKATGRIVKIYKPEFDVVETTEYEVTFFDDPENYSGPKIEKRHIWNDKEINLIPLHYHGTIDRIVIDKFKRIWLMDYKTAKGADTNKLDTDDQIDAYLWAYPKYYGIKPYGFVYLQLTKDVAKPPKRGKKGELSVNKNQKTTYALAKEAILDEFGTMKAVPNKYIEFLNVLAEKESPEGDRFIRWDNVVRKEGRTESTERNIRGEIQTMLSPDLYAYPSPTRDCIWDCPIRDICLKIEDGEDDEAMHELESNYEQRPHREDNEDEKWRTRLVWPDDPNYSLASDAEFMAELDLAFEVELPESYNEDVEDDSGAVFTLKFVKEEE